MNFLNTSWSPYLKVPRSAYLPYKILNAGRTSKDQFLNPPTPEEFLDSIEFGTPFYNPHVTDLYVRYFHMTSITENYLVIPLNSLAIEFMPLMDGVFKNTEPLANVSLRKIISTLKMTKVII